MTRKHGSGPTTCKRSAHKGKKKQRTLPMNACKDDSMLRSIKQATAPPKLEAAKALSRLNLKQKREEIKTNQLQKHRMRRSISGPDGEAMNENLEALTQRVQQNAAKFQALEEGKVAKEDKAQSNLIEIKDNSKRAYMKELRKVVDQSDVILQVLDARDPMGCRCMEMENAILSRGGKRIVLVLNKIDLIPANILDPWLRFLRTQYPTIAFKASTQDQSRGLAQTSGKAEKSHAKALSSSKSIGTDALMQLLKNYCRNAQLKTAITVGIIGYPNVGKSSVINSLKRSKAVGVSSLAGHTKVMQEISLDKKVKLLDCPGIVFDETDANSLLLRNCLNVESMSDPISAVEVILTRCTKEQVMGLYSISHYEDVIDLLVQIANAKGKLGKGGLPDRKMAARIVLQDWNNGKIPFFTPPPEQYTITKNTTLESQVVTSWSEAFDIDKLLNPSVEMPTEELNAKDEESFSNQLVPQPMCSFIPTEPPIKKTIGRLPHTATGQGIHRMRDIDSSENESSEHDRTSDEEGNGALMSTNSTRISHEVGRQPKVLFAEDALNVPTALLSRRKAKQLRKQKRQITRKQIDQVLEANVCDELSKVLEFNQKSNEAGVDDWSDL